MVLAGGLDGRVGSCVVQHGLHYCLSFRVCLLLPLVLFVFFLHFSRRARMRVHARAFRQSVGLVQFHVLLPQMLMLHLQLFNSIRSFSNTHPLEQPFVFLFFFLSPNVRSVGRSVGPPRKNERVMRFGGDITT